MGEGGRKRQRNEKRVNEKVKHELVLCLDDENKN